MEWLNRIINLDCLNGLRSLPDGVVDCCVTSPPYYGLRDYGHDNQIGLEETPEMYVAKLVEVFRDVRRVLKDEGTLWLNLGDSYCGSGAHTGVADPKYGDGRNDSPVGLKNKINGYKSKDLIGIPWMVAFALRADGWYLRQDIIWSKPNPMPESVQDRCTKAHEYVFLLSKSQQYYYDSESIKEPLANTARTNFQSGSRINGKNKDRNDNDLSKRSKDAEYIDRNKRSVWTVTTKPFADAHFATFPEDLIVPCIKAGCPENGVVLDPFMGAGTTALVSRKLTRNFVGFELNPEYIKIANRRVRPHLAQKSIFDELLK